MDSETLKKHCPNARFYTRALIPNWEVQFNFMSRTYNGGVTGIEPAIANVVRGVVYDVPEGEMMHLDSIEGVPEGIYYRQTVYVIAEGGGILKTYTYRTANPKGPFKPTKKYIDLMIKGAKEHNLDPKYIEWLENIETAD